MEIKKSLIAILLLVFNGVLSVAQEVEVSGTVKTTDGSVLEMVNVVAFDLDGKLANYAISNNKGTYRMNLVANQTYFFQLSFVGFENIKEKRQITSKAPVFDFVLEEVSEGLEEVKLTYEMPVQIKGDTIVYNTDSFSNGTEQKLGDVLEKLPGVEVSEDGEIEVEGKKVAKVMVEGKDFFDGDTKLAVENIPANALAKIEVLRNFNEVSQMKPLMDNQENVAINIKLKEGKKRFTFGQIAAGLGSPELYRVQPKIFMYSPDRSLNVLTDFNNVGTLPFTTRDYYRFTGGFRNLSTRGGTTINVGNNAVGLATLENNRAANIVSKFGALNFSVSPSKQWQHNGFFIYSGNETLLEEAIQKNYFNESDNALNETIDNHTTQQTHLGLVKWTTHYERNANFQFNYDLFAKFSKQEESDERLSYLNGTLNNQIGTNKADQPFAITQNFDSYWNVNSAQVMALEMQWLLQKERPDFIQELSNQPNIAALLAPDLIAANSYKLEQTQETFTSKLTANMNYYFILNANSHIAVTGGFLYTDQTFDSALFQYDNSGTQIAFERTDLNNAVSFQFVNPSLGLLYKYQWKKWMFEPSLTQHFYNNTISQLGNSYKRTSFQLLPAVLANYQFKQSENLRFQYSQTNQFTDINRLSEGYLYRNYNNLYRGNSQLTASVFHRLSLKYFNFILFNYTNVNLQLNYQKKKGAIKNSSQITGIAQEVQAINAELPDESLTFSGRYGRTFRKIKINTRASFNWSNQYNIRNSQYKLNEVLTYQLGGNIGTNFQEAPNIKLGVNYIVNDYGNDIYTTLNPTLKFDALLFKEWMFKTQYRYFDYNNQDQTITNTYAFLDSSLSYQKKDSDWEFRLRGTNLTNNKTLNRDSFNAAINAVTSRFYKVQPRMLLFQVVYHL